MYPNCYILTTTQNVDKITTGFPITVNLNVFVFSVIFSWSFPKPYNKPEFNLFIKRVSFIETQHCENNHRSNLNKTVSLGYKF